MKKIIYLPIAILFVSCVSQGEHDRVTAKMDSLMIENQKKQLEISELKTGESRLVNLINYSIRRNKFIDADKYISMLREKHPYSQKLTEFSKEELDSIYQKAQREQAKMNKATSDSIRMANITKLGKWKVDNYTNDFHEPTGEKFILIETKGYFSNSATANSQLNVLIYISQSKIQNESSYYCSLIFDEYCNGTKDLDTNTFREFMYVKMINQKERLVFLGGEDYRNSGSLDLWDDKLNKYTSLIDIFKKELLYECYFRAKDKTEYHFQIDSKFFNNALIKANFE